MVCGMHVVLDWQEYLAPSQRWKTHRLCKGKNTENFMILHVIGYSSIARIYPGHSTTKIFQDIKYMMTETNTSPSEFQGRIISMSMFQRHRVVDEAERMTERGRGRKFCSKCRTWSFEFLGPRDEETLFGTNNDKPNGTIMTSHSKMINHFQSSGHFVFQCYYPLERSQLKSRRRSKLCITSMPIQAVLSSSRERFWQCAFSNPFFFSHFLDFLLSFFDNFLQSLLAKCFLSLFSILFPIIFPIIFGSHFSLPKKKRIKCQSFSQFFNHFVQSRVSTWHNHVQKMHQGKPVIDVDLSVNGSQARVFLKQLREEVRHLHLKESPHAAQRAV